MLTLTRRNRFISMESLWGHFKNSKTTHDAYLCLHLSIHINNISIHLVTPVPLNLGCGGDSRAKACCQLMVRQSATSWVGQGQAEWPYCSLGVLQLVIKIKTRIGMVYSSFPEPDAQVFRLQDLDPERLLFVQIRIRILSINTKN